MSGQATLWDSEPTPPDPATPRPQREDPGPRALANLAARVLDWRRVFADRPATAIEWAQETHRPAGEEVPARERAWGRLRKALRSAEVPGVAESQDDETGEALLALGLPAEEWAGAHSLGPAEDPRHAQQLDLVRAHRPPGPAELDDDPDHALPCYWGERPTDHVEALRQFVNELEHAERYGFASLPRECALAREALWRCAWGACRPSWLMRHLGIRSRRWRAKARALLAWLGLSVDAGGYVSQAEARERLEALRGQE